MNETLQKALELAKQGVVFMAEQIKQVAPEVWRIYIRQVYVESAAQSFAAAIFAFLGIYIYRRLWSYGKSEHEVGALAVSVVIGLAFCGVALGLTCSAILGFINPEYYALDALLHALSGTKP